MREVEFEYPLDEGGRHVIRMIRRYERGLEDFVVIYYAIENDKRVPLVTFDQAHGFMHRDIRYLPGNDKRRKIPLPQLPMDDLFDLAVADITGNWRRYYSEYRRFTKGELNEDEF